MDTGRATGFQLAFLTFAVLLLSVPLWSLAVRWIPPSFAHRPALERLFPFFLAAVVLLSFPTLRRASLEKVRKPIPTGKRLEVGVIAGLELLHGFAWAGAYVLWWSIAEGPVALEQRLQLDSHEAALAKALSVDGFLVNIAIAGLVAPLVEEVVFRGFLYEAWEARYGWIVSMVLTSTVFALYHPNFFPALLGSILYVCVYRRTGTLRAPILLHAIGNIAAFYPLLGQFVFPRNLEAPGDASSWGMHIAILFVVIVAMALYIWIARTPARDPSETLADAPLPR